jgi:hypothetical protein
MTMREDAASESTRRDARPVAEMSLAEVLGFLQGLGQATFQDINQAYSRLIAIGLFEHGYKDANRDTALGIADTVKVQILKTLADHPDLKAEFEQAAAMQIQQAKVHGIGSDAWRAEEERVLRRG